MVGSTQNWNSGSIDKFGTRTALITNDNRHFTYEELGKLTTRLALHLRSMGLQEGDRIILQIPNCAEAVIMHFATMKAGVIPIMVLPAYRESEISHFMKHCQARAIAVASTYRGFDF